MPKGAYLSYNEYADRGGELPQSSFSLLEFQARKRIDYLTDSRVQAMAEVPEAIKLCIMALIPVDNKLGASAQASNPVVTSFSTDGYSESYGKVMGVTDAELAMSGMIKTYLYGEVDDNGVELLYRGVS